MKTTFSTTNQPLPFGTAVFNYTTYLVESLLSRIPPQFTAKLGPRGIFPVQQRERLTDLTAKPRSKNGVLWKQSRLPFL